MNDYKTLVLALRIRAANLKEKFSTNASLLTELMDAADAIEELLKAARAMHLWIFLNTGDEEKVYEECGLSDEMNAALGYGGKMVFRSDPLEKKHE